MLKIHKEGRRIIGSTIVFLIVVNLLIFWLWAPAVAMSLAASVVFLFLLLQFFRNPRRELVSSDDNTLYAPADGKIVAIEEVMENEYFNDRRLQVSIFMSPTNVHVNRNPISGTVNYFKYHPGRYLMAWHPKSSTENERTTIVIDNGDEEILLRQIAGFMAKRIVSYLDEGVEVEQGADLGFIKFGSRVDLLLPLDSKINVELGDRVKGNRTIIAFLGQNS